MTKLVSCLTQVSKLETLDLPSNAFPRLSTIKKLKVLRTGKHKQMPEIKFPSEWLKIGVNVQPGDLIRFMDAGTQDAEGNWVFNVQIIHEGNLTETKKFQLNKTNHKVISELHGTNSDNWVGQDMQVDTIKQRNPQTGLPVDSILLAKPISDPLAE